MWRLGQVIVYPCMAVIWTIAMIGAFIFLAAAWVVKEFVDYTDQG